VTARKIEPATFRLVAQCLIHLPYTRVPAETHGWPSSDRALNRLRARWPGYRSSVPRGARVCSPLITIQTDSELDPPSYRIVMRVNVNTYLYAVPKLRMPGTLHPLPDLERTRLYLRLRNLQGTPCQFLFLNSLNDDLNPICHLQALLGAHHILHVGRIRVN